MRSPEKEEAGLRVSGAGQATNQKIARPPDSTHPEFTAPVQRQAAGLLRQLQVAEDQVLQAEVAGSWLAARQARRAANRFRRQLRPAPVDGGAAVPGRIRAAQIGAIVAWAERRQGAGR